MSVPTAPLHQPTNQLPFILPSTTGEPLFNSIYQTAENYILNLAVLMAVYAATPLYLNNK